MAIARAAAPFEFWVPNAAGGQLNVYLAGSTTLAPLWLDIGLTIPATNPQTLQTLTVGDISYGRLAQPVYTNVQVQWEISGSRSGVISPTISVLDGVTGDGILVTADGSTEPRTLAVHLDDFVQAADFGVLGTNAGTNTATLNQAIGVVASRNGGTVLLPPGAILISQLTLPDGVLLRGCGRGATILMSQVNGSCISIGGDRAGLSELTLDGINLTPGSIGVLSLNKNETRYHDVEMKRFETCLWCRGGRRADWRDLYITNGVNGARLWGDNALGLGGEFRDNFWSGGRVIQCTGVGIELSFEDKLCIQNTIMDVGFEDNTGPALKINGARFTRVISCWATGNTTPLDIRDDDNTSLVAQNTVQEFSWVGGGIVGGTVALRDSLIGVEFGRLNLSGVAFAITAPKNNFRLVDCIEDAAVTVTGVSTALTRIDTTGFGEASGITSGNVATKAWSTGSLAPGEVVFLTARVMANMRNGIKKAEYHIETSGYRPGSALAYDTQTANFTLGQVVTGATTGAKGLITADADAGATGTLTLREITGEFIDNEIITDPLGGSATANGVLSHQNAALLGAVTAIRAAREDNANCDATFAANGPEIELRVTGDTAETYSWVAEVSQTRN